MGSPRYVVRYWKARRPPAGAYTYKGFDYRNDAQAFATANSGTVYEQTRN